MRGKSASLMPDCAEATRLRVQTPQSARPAGLYLYQLPTMTSTEHQHTTLDATNASPRSEPASFEIIDAPAVDVVPSESTPDVDTEVHTEEHDGKDAEENPTIDNNDAAVKLATAIQISLHEPLVVHAIASRARRLLLKDFARINGAMEPAHESVRRSIDASALTMQAAVLVLLSTSPYTSEFCSRVARQPVLAALATHPTSDPASLAFAYVLINSTEGDELARKAAEIYAVRVRDWFTSRIEQAKPAYTSLASAARIVWGQSTEWVRICRLHHHLV